MDPINPILNNPPVHPSNHNNNLAVISMAVFVLMSLSVVGYLYYQNQQLKNMLANYQTPTISPTPIATTNPTADWETYISSSKDYSVKHPKGLKIDNNTAGAGEESTRFVYMGQSQIDSGRTQTELADGYFFVIAKIGKNSQFEPKAEITKSLANTKEECVQDNASFTSVTQMKLGEINAYQYSASCRTDYTITYLSDSKNTYSITQFFTNQDYKTITDQILSTFKFISPSPSISPSSLPVPIRAPSATSKACTMEAKICPDGSSVGRTGPNCEFAVCPTP